MILAEDERAEKCFWLVKRYKSMSAISTGRKEVMSYDKTRPQKDYLTTTELARFCGVSRFTIINWTNRGKIKAIRTAGGHYRIPVSEAVSFLDVFHKDKNGVASGSLGRCWEYLQKTNCHKECSNCLIYRRETDYCFEVARQFGKGVIRCTGECLDCGYFQEFFSFHSERAQLKETCDKRSKKATKSKEATTEKKNLLYSVVYGAGRGVHQMKKRAVSIRERLSGRRGINR